MSQEEVTHCQQIDACLFCGCKELIKSKDAFGGEVTWFSLEQTPVSIERHTAVT